MPNNSKNRQTQPTADANVTEEIRHADDTAASPQSSGTDESSQSPKDSEASENKRELDLSPEGLNEAYLNVWRRLVIMLCAFYARRFPERCLRVGQDTDDVPIQSTVLERALYDDDMFFSAVRLADENVFFDHKEIPGQEEIIDLLVNLSDALASIRNVAASEGVELAIDRIRKTFALSHNEIMLLVVVALAAIDSTVYRAMSFAAGTLTARKFKVSFICDLCGFDRETSRKYMELLSDRGQLIRMRLLIPERGYGFAGLLPRAFADLGIDQRVLDAIKNAELTANLSPHMHLYEQALRPQALSLSKEFTKHFKSLMSMPQARILLTGAPHSGRRTATCSFAKSILKKRVIGVDFVSEIEHLPEDEVEMKICDYLRESLLLNAVLLIRFDSLKPGSAAEHTLDNLQPPLSRHFAYYPGTIVVSAQKSSPTITRLFENMVECHIHMPAPAEQERIWLEALTGIFDDHELHRIASSFSNNYQLTVGEILQTVQRSLDAHAQRAEVDPTATLESHHILEEIRQCFSHDLDNLADVVLSDIPIERVILPDSTAKTVHEILDFARCQRKVLDEWGYRKCSNYGNSLSMLFAGPPGTGKTLLATAMAHELGKILYRVDLSRIVDKYVGETEKNLAKIFDEAAKAQAILLFDEADSLFAKRTDVKSSNDRYANLEVNFLIQRLESYEGISILTTNLQSSIDEAFKRRLRYIVEFKDPDKEERMLLWKSLIAPKTPLQDDINWRILAESFELSGGHIRNATLNASIRAAAKNEALGMQYLLEAAIAETQKLGKLVKLSDRVLLILDSYGVEI